MTDRGIIFSAPMVLALLSGRKVQTRRLTASPLRKCVIGDRLWVREQFMVQEVQRRITMEGEQHHVCVDMVADGARIWCDVSAKVSPKILRAVHYRKDRTRATSPSIHLPRIASRITLTVTDVRVQRLTSISGHDARCEGVARQDDGWRDYSGRYAETLSPVESFATLWDTLHTKDGERWQDKPDVVALTFTVERGNIDRLAA